MGLARLAAIPLLSDNSSLGVETTSLIAFDDTENKLAVGMPAIPFAPDFGIVCEDFLTSYYHDIIREVIPFYSLAYGNFLSSTLTATAQELISGILGPNRLSVTYLDTAMLYAGLELQVLWEVFDARGLSAERPVIVGHGANGLLAKALNIDKDPWRISFEAPKLEDTPIATLANAANNDPDRSRIFNFYGDGSFYSLSDDRALINNRIPKYGLRGVVPPNSFETFCFFVAACSNEDQFDNLCTDVFHDRKKNFSIIGRDLERPRLPSSDLKN
jgi:hypothetical protein